MSQAVRIFRCAVLALLVMVCTVPAFGQTEPQAPPEGPARTVEFMPRAAFHMAAEYLADEDPRFMWDADFGGELDIVEMRKQIVKAFE